MKTDTQIQGDVIAELKWEPLLNASEIGVSVKNGVVTLSGKVDSYFKKVAADKAAKRVSGVKIVAEDIQVGLSPEYRKSDTDIAEAVIQALKWNAAVQAEKIKIRVEDGVVRLEGEVEWPYQRNSAVEAIEKLKGVKSVINMITLLQKASAEDIGRKITAAFARNAAVDSGKVKVEVFGNKAILTGTVCSFAEKEEAERAAWAAKGVNTVENRLEIAYPDYSYME